ncbi:beta-ketoacyl-ACP synthase III [Streptomyces alanosinicus]|uniref:Beta-ketoacyl-[acyl-carrier-protein] synthase III n=1 Tax=Streptomyces alanosinicus TaxID=68171 RepID=A0A918YTB9_9ACTN|nr:beta-ketoacyl-ACP synthase III [Streptomyces alanosinicus]GHE15892.1 3-oxoacyl-[acyl-carrier-protein] synthase 3 [Streptomyces alanosinicus]
MSDVAVVAGLGSWLPPRTVSNEQLCARVGGSAQWIEQRVGVRRRHVVSPGEATCDLAVRAGGRVLRAAGGAGVDAVVLATTSPDRLCPATAPEVASRLGCGPVLAFDVSAACSGFLYGLAVCAGLVSAGLATRVLFIGAEAFTTLVNPLDRTTAAVFGDGAGAVLLRGGTLDEPGALGPFVLGSDGARSDLLAVPAGGSRQRSRCGLGHDGHVPDADWYLAMAGPALFRQAVVRMAESSRTALDRAGWSLSDVDVFVGHQANLRILDAVSERLGIPHERVAVNIGRVANTLTASVPLALVDAVVEGRLRPGHRVLLCAFGAGPTWGATTLVWPEIPTAHLIGSGAVSRSTGTHAAVHD